MMVIWWWWWWYDDDDAVTASIDSSNGELCLSYSTLYLAFSYDDFCLLMNLNTLTLPTEREKVGGDKCGWMDAIVCYID